LTSALDGGEWLVSRLGRFTPREITSIGRCIGSCMGTWAGLDARGKSFVPARHRVRSPLLYRLSYPSSIVTLGTRHLKLQFEVLTAGSYVMYSGM
jgi:hypothetical protein